MFTQDFIERRISQYPLEAVNDRRAKVTSLLHILPPPRMLSALVLKVTMGKPSEMSELFQKSEPLILLFSVRALLAIRQ